MMHTAENKTRIYIYRTPISLYSVHIQYTRCTLLADKNMNKLCKQFSFVHFFIFSPSSPWLLLHSSSALLLEISLIVLLGNLLIVQLW